MTPVGNGRWLGAVSYVALYSRHRQRLWYPGALAGAISSSSSFFLNMYDKTFADKMSRERQAVCSGTQVLQLKV